MESVCFNRVLGGTEPQDFLCRIGRIQITGKSSVNGKYKDPLALEITEIILLPLMRFALFIRRTAPGMGQRHVHWEGYNGENGTLTRREVARMELI
jgi:hypothetical protein